MNLFNSTHNKLNLALMLTASMLLSACANQPVVNAEPAVKSEPIISTALTKERQAQITPTAAVNVLMEGNNRFLTGTMLKRDLLAQEQASGTGGQFPLASIVSCIDSRADPALIFDQGLGDLFVARVAGNIVNPDILGSLEYAAKVAGSKAIVVLGHTHCGAIKGACDGAKMGNLTQLVGKINPAVKATPSVGGKDRTSKNHEFVDAAAQMNVAHTLKAIRTNSAILKDMEKKGLIKIVGAMLDVETGKITFMDESLPAKVQTTIKTSHH
ncbi:MAG: hypothetical protein RL497_850 [Pseudomonadota bacterium]